MPCALHRTRLALRSPSSRCPAHSSIPPKSNSVLFARCMAEHRPIFDVLVAGKPGFPLVGDDEFAYAFHAKIVGGEIVIRGALRP